MRRLFIQVEQISEAKNIAPWAVIIIAVEGGFHAFESWTDYETWSRAK